MPLLALVHLLQKKILPAAQMSIPQTTHTSNAAKMVEVVSLEELLDRFSAFGQEAALAMMFSPAIWTVGA